VDDKKELLQPLANSLVLDEAGMARLCAFFVILAKAARRLGLLQYNQKPGGVAG